MGCLNWGISKLKYLHLSTNRVGVLGRLVKTGREDQRDGEVDGESDALVSEETRLQGSGRKLGADKQLQA